MIYDFPGAKQLLLKVKFTEVTPLIGELWLLDFTGKIVFWKTVSSQAEINVPMGDLPKGAYLLSIRADGFLYTKKVVK